MSKITVIGAGSVGATIANDLMIQGTASEIVLVDINKRRGAGHLSRGAILLSCHRPLG